MMPRATARVLALLLALLSVTACTTPQYSQAVYRKNLGQKTETLRSDNQPKEFRIHADVSAGKNWGQLSLKLEELTEEYRSQFEKIEIRNVEYEHYRDLNFFAVFLCEIYGLKQQSLLCISDKQVKVEHEKRNIVNQPATQSWKTANDWSDYRIQLFAIGKDSARHPLDKITFSTDTWDGYRRLNLRSLLLSSPRRPVTAVLELDRLNTLGEIIYEVSHTITEDTINKMALQNIAWLSLEEQKKHHMVALRDALINDNHSSAVNAFEHILTLGLDVPDSFFYRYGQSLDKIYRKEKAIGMYKTYLSKAGSDGKYSAEARAAIQRTGR